MRFGADYRFIDTKSVDLTFTQDAVTVGRSVSTDYNDHAILLTMRWKFGGPPFAAESVDRREEPRRSYDNAVESVESFLCPVPTVMYREQRKKVPVSR